MSEYRSHQPAGSGSHHGSDRGPPRHYQHPPGPYSAIDQPTSPHGPYNAQRDQDYGRRYAPHDLMPRTHYGSMDGTPPSRRDVITSSKASVASYPRSEAGSTAPPPVPTPSHQSEAEIALATSKKQLHAVTPHPPTRQPAPTFEPASEYHPREGRRSYMGASSHGDGLRDEPPALLAFASSARQHAVDLGVPAQAERTPESLQPHDAPVVSTWHRGHKPPEPFGFGSSRRRYGGGFSTTAYDANSVAVPNPRSWGRPSDSSPQVHEQPRTPSLHRFGQTQDQHVNKGHDALAHATAQYQSAPHSAPPPSSNPPRSDYNPAVGQEHRPPHLESIHQVSGPVHEEQRASRSPAFSQQSAPARSRHQSRHVSPAYHSHGLLPNVEHPQQVVIHGDPNTPSTFHGPPAHAVGPVRPQLQSASADACVDLVPGTASRPQPDSVHLPAARHGDSHSHEQQPVRARDGPMLAPDARETRRVSYVQPHSTTEFNPPRHSTPHQSLPDVNKPALEHLLASDGPGDDHGWARKPSVKLANDDAAWNSPNIQAWASNVNDTQQVPAAAVLSTGAADDISLPERPDNAKPVPKPVTIYISPEPSPRPGEASAVREAPVHTGIVAKRPVELSGKIFAPVNANRRPKSTEVEDGDDFDRPSTPSDMTDTPSVSKDDGRHELDPEFWKESTHPRDSPRFQSRRVIVIAPFPIRIDAFEAFLRTHFARYGELRCVSPFPLHTPGFSDKAAVVFHLEESIAKLMNDDRRHEGSFQSATTSSAVPIQLRIFQRPAEEEFLGIWIKVTGPRHDDRSRSASPTSTHRQQFFGNFENDWRPVPPALDVWALPSPSSRGRMAWRIKLWDVRNGELEPGEQRAPEDFSPIKVGTIPLGRRDLERDVLPKLVSFYCEIIETIPPTEPWQPWRFVVCRSWKIGHLIKQLEDLPGFAVGKWNCSVKWRGDSPLPTFSPEPSDVGIGDGVAVRSPQQANAFSPNLKRRIVPTYKGRPVRADMWRGNQRFYDDAAIFVAGIPLEESEENVLERFSKYGKVVDLEYERRFRFAEARVMYETKMGAHSAMLYEDGANIAGQSIRVRDRRIPPRFVVAREVLVDESGRMIDRSEVQHADVPSQSAPPLVSGQALYTAAVQHPSSEDRYVYVKLPRLPPAGSVANLLPAYMVTFDYSASGEIQTRVHLCPSVGVTSTANPAATTGSRTASRCEKEATATAPKTKPSVKSSPINPDEFLPRVLSTKMEDGQLKPVYDSDDIKKWKIKNGIPLDEPVEETNTPPRTETVSLLPVQTGGHDPSRPAEASHPTTDAAHGQGPSRAETGEHRKPVSTTDREDEGGLPCQPQQQAHETPQQIHVEPRRGVAHHHLHGRSTSYAPVPVDRQSQHAQHFVHRHRDDHRSEQSLPLGESPHHEVLSQHTAATALTGAHSSQVPRSRQAEPPRSGHNNSGVEPRRQSDGYYRACTPRSPDTWAEPRRQADNIDQGLACRSRSFYCEAEISQSRQHAPSVGGPTQHEPAGERYQHLAPHQVDPPPMHEPVVRPYQETKVPHHYKRPHAFESTCERFQRPEAPCQYDPPRAYPLANQVGPRSSTVLPDRPSHPQAASQPATRDSHLPRQGGVNPTHQQDLGAREAELGWGPPPSRTGQPTGPPKPTGRAQSTGAPQPAGPPQSSGPAQPASLPVDFAPPMHFPDREDSVQTSTAKVPTSVRKSQPV